ncbi:hypothetical protein [Pseudanabaena sp. FACHB-2040]|nr:hypothetical protein [Pseudanabaena sp. FACHB-2040]
MLQIQYFLSSPLEPTWGAATQPAAPQIPLVQPRRRRLRLFSGI